MEGERRTRQRNIQVTEGIRRTRNTRKEKGEHDSEGGIKHIPVYTWPETRNPALISSTGNIVHHMNVYLLLTL